jgi:Skp family chaperone for outer membrane proteins
MSKRMRQALCILMLLPCLNAYGQQGYIEYDQLVKTLPGYLAAKDNIEAKRRQWSDSVRWKGKAFQDFVENELPHNQKLDLAEVMALEDTIKKMEVNIQYFQTLAQREIKKVEEISDARLKEYVSMKLQDFCATKGILCVVDKDSILYCSGCVDYTEDFLDYLAKNK